MSSKLLVSPMHIVVNVVPTYFPDDLIFNLDLLSYLFCINIDKMWNKK